MYFNLFALQGRRRRRRRRRNQPDLPYPAKYCNTQHKTYTHLVAELYEATAACTTLLGILLVPLVQLWKEVVVVVMVVVVVIVVVVDNIGRQIYKHTHTP